MKTQPTLHKARIAAALLATAITARADITVNGTSGLATVTDIAAAIHAALATGDATVTGELHGVTQELRLAIPAARTVTWQAAYSGNPTFLIINWANASTPPDDKGTLVIADGAAVTNTSPSASHALYSAGDIRVTGGAVATHGNDSTIAGLATDQAPILLGNASTLNLTLHGQNTLTAGLNRAAIQTAAATLRITAASTSTLNATGGDNAAGIGGGGTGSPQRGGNGGAVTISGGGVTARCDSPIPNGAAIGAGYRSASGTPFDGGTLTVCNCLLDVDSLPYAYSFQNAYGDKTKVTILSGILRDGGTYTVHGKAVALPDTPLTLAPGQTLHIPDGALLLLADLTAHPAAAITGPGRLILLDQLAPPEPEYIKATSITLQGGDITLTAQGKPDTPYTVIGTPTFTPFDPALRKTSNPDGTITFTFPDPDYRTFFFKVREVAP